MSKPKTDKLMTVGAIATALQLSEPQVTKALKSALKKLKIKLSELEDFEDYLSDKQNRSNDS